MTADPAQQRSTVDLSHLPICDDQVEPRYADSIRVAPYLLEPGLVLETGAHEVRSARQHLWAEPLDRSLRLYLRAQISNELGFELSRNAIPANAPDFILDVEVEELHGTLSGAARLVASWRITRVEDGEKLAAFRFARTLPLARDGYAALADAEVALVRELAAAIAKSLRDPLLQVFPAALLGRIVTIPYYPLSDDMVAAIARLQLGRIEKRIWLTHKVPFTYDDAVVTLIASRCTELESGGRMIDAILTNSMLPSVSREFLTRMMESKPVDRVHIAVSDGDFTYQFE